MSVTERIRSRVPTTETADFTYTKDIYYPGTCTTLPLYSASSPTGTRTVRHKEETMKDVVVTDFHRLRDKGMIFNNPMTQTVVERNFPIPSVDIWVERTSRMNCSGNYLWKTLLYQELSGEFPVTTTDNGNESTLFPTLPDLEDEIAARKSLAINEAWANIDSSEILALVSAMESGKTVRGVTDTFRRLVKFLRNVKRLQLAELRKLAPTHRDRVRLIRRSKKAWNSLKEEFSLGAICDRYMELRYGWRPLIYDMYGAKNAFEAEFTNLRQTFRGFESFSANYSPTSCTRDINMQTWGYARMACTLQTAAEVTCRAGVLCDVNLSQMDPWGLSKVPESALELIPYSFVLNWFFNISDTLAAWTPDVGFNPLASWVVTKQVITQTCSVSSDLEMVLDDDTSSTRYEGEGTCTAVELSKTTTIKTRVPDPSRSILPTMKLRLNTAKLADLAIMAKNLLYGGRYPLAQRSLRI